MNTSVSEELDCAPPQGQLHLGPIMAIAMTGIVITTLAVWAWHFMSMPSRAAVTPPRAIPLIAVMPFHSLTGRADDDRLNGSLTESLVGRLAEGSRARVLPAAALQPFANSGATDPLAVGRQLGVQGIVIGMVQRLHGRMRVDVQMVCARDGRQIWTGGFDAGSAGIPALAERISDSMAKHLTALLD